MRSWAGSSSTQRTTGLVAWIDGMVGWNKSGTVNNGDAEWLMLSSAGDPGVTCRKVEKNLDLKDDQGAAHVGWLLILVCVRCDLGLDFLRLLAALLDLWIRSRSARLSGMLLLADLGF